MAAGSNSPRRTDSAIRRGVRYFRATAIGQGQGQGQLGIARGHLFRVLHKGLNVLVQSPAFPDHLEAHVLLMKFGDLGFQIAPQQPHQVADFLFRTPPVFGRETEQRQIIHAKPASRLDDLTDGLRTLPVPRDARQPTAFAQRPLPSMMMATCFGGGISAEELVISGKASYRRTGQTCMMSFSLSASDVSTLATYSSVSF